MCWCLAGILVLLLAVVLGYWLHAVSEEVNPSNTLPILTADPSNFVNTPPMSEEVTADPSNFVTIPPTREEVTADLYNFVSTPAPIPDEVTADPCNIPCQAQAY